VRVLRNLTGGITETLPQLQNVTCHRGCDGAIARTRRRCKACVGAENSERRNAKLYGGNALSHIQAGYEGSL
jgi:hypothetical protein